MYETTPPEPDADDSAIVLTVPATGSVPTALIVTSAAWPTLRLGTSLSENAAVTAIPLDCTSMAVPDGAVAPATMFTAEMRPAMGALIEALSTAVWAASTFDWALATPAWSEAIWAAVDGAMRVV